MIPLAAATVAGWLLLFVVLLILPSASRSGREEGAAPGVEPPAVVSLLAGRLERDGFAVTLADLAARGWFRLSGTPGPAGPAGPAGLAAGPVMCVIPAETPAEALAPYERRVMAHVARRAGVRGEVPAPALSDSFEGGETAFLKAFRDEVTADAEQRGLTRPRLSGRRVGLLVLALFVPAGATAIVLDAAHRSYPLAWPAVSWFVLSLVTAGVGASRRPSAAGQAVLGRWHSAADEARRGRAARGGARGVVPPGRQSYGSEDRFGAYAAALGRAPGAVAAFTAPGKDLVWSSYRGSWQQLPVETHGGSWPVAIVAILAIIFGPIAYIGGVIWLFAAGLGWIGERVLELTAGAVLVGLAIWAARRMTPRFAEFDGQVIRQTFIEHDEDPDEYRVVVDDGARPTAWDLKVPAGAWRLLTPGTFVHARVNLNNRDVTIDPVEPPAVARPLAAVAAEQERAGSGVLPDPGRLVTADEAAEVLRGPVRGRHADGPGSRAMIWQPSGAAQPILRIEVRPAGSGPRVPADARPVPGVGGGFLLGQSAMLYTGSCIASIGVHGAGQAADEASLTRLLALVSARLPGLVIRP
ncbi:MAG TPA: hypothetical protein VKU77_33275 [Streptosporangiaceae bacterium]|nr:hypothetical protein [Streptosporangiaceae bacterium]